MPLSLSLLILAPPRVVLLNLPRMKPWCAKQITVIRAVLLHLLRIKPCLPLSTPGDTSRLNTHERLREKANRSLDLTRGIKPGKSGLTRDLSSARIEHNREKSYLYKYTNINISHHAPAIHPLSRSSRYLAGPSM